jgi:aspartokinase/homoserine dehydrogenase 1
MKKVREIVHHAMKSDDVMMVASAMSGTTDMLILCGRKAAEGDDTYKELLATIEERHLQTVRELIPIQHQSHVLSFTKTYCNELEDILNGIFLLGELSLRTLDRIMSFGELMSSRILAASFATESVDCQWVDARQVIRTNSQYGHGVVDFTATYAAIRELRGQSKKLWVIPGFIAADKEGVTTTLGRGGSDYTAAIFAAGAEAGSLEIWTDVSGMMTADPRWVPNARPIPAISYKEAMELSHFGAKVIYPPTIQPVMSRNIPVWVKNTFAPEDHGTVIHNETVDSKDTVTGISSINHIALISLEGSGMIGIPGFSKRLFEALASEKINVILITQSSSEHSICVAIQADAVERARAAVDAAFEREIALGKVEPLSTESDLSVIAIVGEHMKSHPGISGKMFGAMGRNGVNVRAIAQGSSERNISAVISTADVRKTVNILHEEFFETTYRQVNLFVAGTGNVGRRLFGQLKQQAAFLQKNLRLQVRVVGLINSRTMVIGDDALNGNWEQVLERGEKADLQAFVQHIQERNMRNSVFVDVTASDKVAAVYPQLLQKSIAVVACNKIAASSSFAHYSELKDLAADFNTRFLFETNVGAGLPVIGTLNDLLRSGDRINRIEAVLSGTLNFVFNHYDGKRSFAEVVKQAQDEGYTEPDPRLDLSGTDVARKILILARESGEQMEMDQVGNESFLPASCMEGSVDDFYKELARHEAHFKKIRGQRL